MVCTEQLRTSRLPIAGDENRFEFQHEVSLWKKRQPSTAVMAIMIASELITSDVSFQQNSHKELSIKFIS